MMYISWTDHDHRQQQRHWWVGQPLPEIDGRVVSFQADGHELEALLNGMENSYVQSNGRVGYERAE